MIVICTKCHAKFRVADEKIGPRGAKVRCSRCGTVFPIEREVAAERPALPVTDLSDLLGPVAPPPVQPPALPPPLPSAAARSAAPPLVPDAPALAPAAAGLALDLSSLPVPESTDPFAVAAAREAAHAEPSALADEIGLALEDRHTPPPMKVFPFDDPVPPAADEPFDRGAFGWPAGGDDAAPELDANDDAAAPGAVSAVPAAPAPRSEARAPHAAEAPRRARAPERIPAERPSPLREVAVNALALVALLAMAVGMLAVWRTDGPIRLDAATLWRALAGFRGAAAASPFAAQEVRSGVYERERGAPILFVRGLVVSHATAPVPAVLVSVAVMRGDAVLARGETIAGAVPTPEELYTATDDAALDRAATAARARAPGEVRPGDALPFLVAIGNAPSDLEGASLRVELAPGGASP